MKKNYIAPCSNIIHLQMEQPILSASEPHINLDNDNQLDASDSYSEHKESFWGEQESQW